MNTIIFLALFLGSSFSYAFQCDATCTQFQTGTCAGKAAERFIKSFPIRGHSTNSKEEAFQNMKANCESKTPSALSFSVDIKLYTYWNKFCSAEVIHNSSVYANAGNSCY